MADRPLVSYKDDIIYWTMPLYTGSGILVDADSTPTVTVRKNNAATGTTATVAKRSGSSGIYDVSYDPSGESVGDVYTFEEVAVISTDISGQSYYNSFSTTILADPTTADGDNPRGMVSHVLNLQYTTTIT